MYKIKKHNLNYQNLGHLKWTGTFWVVSRNLCNSIDPDKLWLENKVHNCNHKNFPVAYQPKTEQGFTVTDERYEQMLKDGTVERLAQLGVRVDGGGDPLYFEWHNKIADIYNEIPTRSNSTYSSTYPYLELYTLDDVFDEEYNLDLNSMMNWLSQIGSSFYTGDNFAKKHEATLQYINQTTDVDLLKNAKDKYVMSLEDMRKANDNPTTNAIDFAFQRALELGGSNVITDALGFGYERIKRLVRVMDNMYTKELNAIENRIQELSFDVGDKTVIGDKFLKPKKQAKNKIVVPVLGTLAILNILSLFK